MRLRTVHDLGEIGRRHPTKIPAATQAIIIMQKKVDVGAVIDSAKIFPVPFTIAVMLIIIMLTDGFDLGTMGRVATPIAGAFGDGALNPINTAGLAGMAIGSVGMGWLGDRIGRKRSYIACVALLFIGSLLCYFAQDVTQLTLFRGLTGLGLGGVTPLAATLMSEWAPKKVRSIMVAAVVVAVPLGAALAGPIERMVVPDSSWHAAIGLPEGEGWRAMFLVGALVPLALLAIFAFILPESPKYMAQHRKLHPQLAKALNRLVGEKRYDGTEDFFVQETVKDAHAPAATTKPNFKIGLGLVVLAAALAGTVIYFGLGWQSLLNFGVVILVLAAIYQLIKPAFGKIAANIESSWISDIWKREYAVSTALIWAAFSVNSFVLYVFTNYLQRILVQGQLPADTASRAADVFFYGAFFGSIGGAVLIGFFGSRLVGTGLALLGVSATAALGVVLAPDMGIGTLLLLCLLAGMAVNGMQAFMYAVAANAYPTEVRGSAVGVAQTVSRIGAILSPSAYAMYFVTGTTPPVGPYLWFVAGCAIITTVSFFLIPRHIAPGGKDDGGVAVAAAKKAV